MFNSISWTDFLLASACLTAAYYLITGLLFYHHELIARLKGARHAAITPSNLPLPTDGTDNLLGAIKRSLPTIDPEHSDEAEEMQFSGAVEELSKASQGDQPELDVDNTLILGRVADLLEEVKLILSLFTDEKPSKDDFASTLRALLEKYEGLVSSRYLTAINIFLYELCKDTCTDELQPEDVRSWWPAHSPN